MIDHTGLVVSDFERSISFYEKALRPLGYKLLMTIPKSLTGSTDVAGFGLPSKPDFWISRGEPNRPALHVAFRANSRKEVDDFFLAACAAGGRDNGGPGLRPHYHKDYYGAFVLDYDGHNIEAVYHGPA